MTKFIDLTLSGVSSGAVYAAVALALVLIWRATRIVNFAQGAMLMITTYIGSEVITSTGSYVVGFLAALAGGLVLGAIVERVLIRPVENKPELNSVIVALGLYTFLIAVAGIVWGNTPRPFPPAFSILGYDIGGTHVLFAPNDTFIVLVVVVVAAGLGLLFRFTSLGLQLRASAFNPEAAELLGVRVGRMFTVGWGLAALTGAIAGVLVAPSVFLSPTSFDPIMVGGFVAAVLGGLDSPPGAVVGAMLLGVVLSYVGGYEGTALVPMASPGRARARADDPPDRAVPGHQGAPRMTSLADHLPGRAVRRSTLVRSLGLVIGLGVILVLVTDALGEYQDLQLAQGAYFFAALAGLSVLIGLSGKISLGHGAFMAVGAYTVMLLVGHGWALLPAVAGWDRHLGGDRDPGRHRRQPPAGPVPGRRHAGLRRRSARAGQSLPEPARRRERADHQSARRAVVLGRELQPRAVAGVDRLRRRPGGAVRALQPRAQRHRPIAARHPRRRDRRVAVRPERLPAADAGIRGQRGVRRPRRRPVCRGAEPGHPERLPAHPVAVAADGRRGGRARVDGRRGLGRGDAGAAALVDQ